LADWDTEWLHAKTLTTTTERLKSAQEAQTLLETVGISSLKQGQDIIKAFDLLAAPQGAESPIGKSPATKTGDSIRGRQVGACLVSVLKCLKPTNAAAVRGTRGGYFASCAARSHP
jgi:hypothetical protein